MKKMRHVNWICSFIGILLTIVLFLGGCANMNPLSPQTTPTTPAKPVTEVTDVTVSYNYNDTDKVQLSDNNIVLNVGQKLILQPAPGLTKNTRFVSSGDNFIGNVMKQDTMTNDSTKAIFTAIKPGKGILQVIPNTNDTSRAVDLSITIQ